jgi:hypothetical protein
MQSTVKLKREILKLLKENEEFRYAVAGFLRLEEILKGFAKHDEILAKHSEELVKLREDMNKGFARHDAELTKLREEMVKGFAKHDEILAKHSEELVKLREDMNKGFARHDAELTKLREDMNKGFARYDEELIKLREDMNKGFQLLERHISALGARWGLLSETAFREGLKGLLEKELKFKIERWINFDNEGYVYGFPSQIEIDIAIHNEKTILIEIASHIRQSDVTIFKKKAEFYKKSTGKTPEKLMIITPYIEENAKEACVKHNIEFYTKV